MSRPRRPPPSGPEGPLPMLDAVWTADLDVTRGAWRLSAASAPRTQDLLLDEVARSLQSADEGSLEQELAELGLLQLCGPALKRRRGGWRLTRLQAGDGREGGRNLSISQQGPRGEMAAETLTFLIIRPALDGCAS